MRCFIVARCGIGYWEGWSSEVQVWSRYGLAWLLRWLPDAVRRRDMTGAWKDAGDITKDGEIL